MRFRREDLRYGGLFFILMVSASLSLSGQVGRDGPEDILSGREITFIRQPLDTLPDWTLRDTVTLRDTAWVIVGVGDMMLGTHFPSASYLPAHGGRDLLRAVVPWIDSADVAFGNLEGTLIDEGGTVKRCSNPSLCYAFRSPESYGALFRNAGFDLLSLANNHSGDFGAEGRRRTKAVLDSNGIAYAGLAGTDEYAMIERSGLRVGMCAFAPNTGTCSIHDLRKATALVRFLADSCDVVIVSFHGGAEGADHQHVPRRSETYYGENRGDVYRFAHAVIDAGADLVFGHGPHVPRASELYRGRFITYSMGNFCTYGRFSLRGPAGYAPLFRIRVDEEGAFLGGQLISVYQGKHHGPLPDPQKRALRKVRALSQTDFPESPLIFGEDGTISIRR